jgi:vacuolar protein sorting-associated protein 35
LYVILNQGFEFNFGCSKIQLNYVKRTQDIDFVTQILLRALYGFDDLDMAIFDELRYLTTCLYDTHISGSNNLADLYELVQYATHIVPRLYLMITVGAVYMRVSTESQTLNVDNHSESGKLISPTKEIMKDMLEMSRGVQHPTRGLFIRYYLSAVTRDYLPDCTER